MSDIFGKLLLQITLILLNAFFAATEMALVSLNENKLKVKAKDGDRTASRLLKMVSEPSRFLSVIQVVITLSGFLGAGFAAQNFSEPLVNWLVDDLRVGVSRATLASVSVVIITIVLSYFSLVLGELVPKRIAMKKPEAMARIASGIIGFLSALLRPLVWLLTVSTNGVLRLFGINPKEESEDVSEDDIKMMIDIGEERGAIESTEKTMIQNIFQFNNITAEDIMVHRLDVQMIYEDDPPEEITKIITESGFSRFPVCGEDADDIIGILRTREYLLNEKAREPKPLRELLMPPHFVPESVRADILFRDMQKNTVHMAVVVDEYGGTSGIVTLEDLLETIVGDIYDESDSNEQDIIQIDENTWRVRGSVTAYELAEAAGLVIDEEIEEYETISGMIISRLNLIPQDGSTPEVEIQGLAVRVEEVAERRVEWAVISKPPEYPERDEDTKPAEGKDR